MKQKYISFFALSLLLVTPAFAVTGLADVSETIAGELGVFAKIIGFVCFSSAIFYGVVSPNYTISIGSLIMGLFVLKMQDVVETIVPSLPDVADVPTTIAPIQPATPEEPSLFLPILTGVTGVLLVGAVCLHIYARYLKRKVRLVEAAKENTQKNKLHLSQLIMLNGFAEELNNILRKAKTNDNEKPLESLIDTASRIADDVSDKQIQLLNTGMPFASIRDLELVVESVKNDYKRLSR